MIRFECDNCGGIVWKYESQIHPNQELFFCDVECKQKYMSAKYVVYECDICKKVKRVREKVYNSRKNHFCSRECLTKSMEKYKIKTIQCFRCGKDVTRRESRLMGKQIFCSTECEFDYYKEHDRPKDNKSYMILWLNGLNFSGRQIAKKLGINNSTVRYWLRKKNGT